MSETDEPVGARQHVVPFADEPKRVRLPDQTDEQIEEIRRAVGLVHTIQKSNTNGLRPGSAARRTVSFDTRSPFIKSNE